MPRYIIKLNNRYLEWSTVVDAPITYGLDREEFKEYYMEQYHLKDTTNLEYQLKMADDGKTLCAWAPTADALIENNRAGVYEGHLSKRQLINKFIRSRPGCWDDQ